MKILHFTQSVNPLAGGTIEAIKRLAEAHQQQGHLVEVVSLDPPAAPWVAQSALTVHALGLRPSSYGYTPRLFPWMREHGREFDIVVSHGLWQFNGFATWRALSNSSTPFCVFPHGMLDPWFRKRYPLKHLKKWLYWLGAEHRVLRRADGVLFTCEEERLQARRTFWPYRCNEMVVSFGTAAPTGEPERQRRCFLETFPRLRNKRLLLFLGRVHEKKGCHELLRAFRQVLSAEKASEIHHLVMAGPADHTYGQGLKEAVIRLGLNDRVTWTGMLDGDLKWGAFHSSEAFVLPSHQENFGIAVAEALACGVPVLISNQVNIWREIEQDRAGLIENDDLAGTIRLLERWLRLAADERTAMRHAATQCFASRFEITKAAEDLVRVFERLIDLKMKHCVRL